MRKQQQEETKIFFRQLDCLKEDESGATAVEYAVILTLIAAVIIFTVSLVGEDTRKAYEKVNTVLVENTSTDVDEDKCKGKDSEDDEDCGIGND